jgi:hypothetical protein
MPHVVIGTATAIVCHREVRSEEALEQARTASAEFPDATDLWLFGRLSESPWHASLTPLKGSLVKISR